GRSAGDPDSRDPCLHPRQEAAAREPPDGALPEVSGGGEVSRRPLFALCAALLIGIGCGPDKPRALVLADGSGIVHGPPVRGRVKPFAQPAGRQVRVLVVAPDQAVLLAGRGEADVAIVPTETPLDTFIASEHGSLAGLLNDNGEHLKVIEVNAKQHPKVEPKG